MDKYEFLPNEEQKINEILERLERIETMLKRLIGNNYSGKYVPPPNSQWIDPESTAGNWHGRIVRNNERNNY